MPEVKMTRAEWEKQYNIEMLQAQIDATDAEIQDVIYRKSFEIKELEERKATIQCEIDKMMRR